MALDIPSFELRFPELAGQDPAMLALLYDDAMCLTADENRWCAGKYETAMQYLVAHLLSMRVGMMAQGAGGGGKAGPIVSKTAKGVSVTYAAPANMDDSEAWFSGTEYGRLYLRLYKQCFTGMGVTVGVDRTAWHGCFASGNFRGHFQ